MPAACIAREVMSHRNEVIKIGNGHELKRRGREARRREAEEEIFNFCLFTKRNRRRKKRAERGEMGRRGIGIKLCAREMSLNYETA